jgi:hypothetical protein
VNPAGATTGVKRRTSALIVSLLNLGELATNETLKRGRAKFGEPILLNLGGRGVRSIDSNFQSNYLIVAGPVNEASNPPRSPSDFRLFTWSGNPAETPTERTTQFPNGYSPEGALVSASPLTSESVVQFVSDDSGSCWKSFTTSLGEAVAQ